MKLETGIIITKGACDFISTGALAALACLAQWGSAEAIPPTAKYIIWLAAFGNGAKGLGSFLSTSFGKYLETRTNGNGTQPTTEPKP